MLELAAVAAVSAFLHWRERMRFVVAAAVAAAGSLAAAGLAIVVRCQSSALRH